MQDNQSGEDEEKRQEQLEIVKTIKANKSPCVFNYRNQQVEEKRFSKAQEKEHELQRKKQQQQLRESYGAQKVRARLAKMQRDEEELIAESLAEEIEDDQQVHK